MKFSFVFRHRYTGKLICSVPCDDMDDLCQLNEDDDCQQRDILIVVALLFACVSITVLVGEAVVRYLKSRKIEGDWELDSENSTAIALVKKFLDEFLSNHSKSKSAKKSAKKLFKVIFFTLH